MRKIRLLLMLFVFAAVAFSINKVVSDNKKADLRKEREQINYKIDNMGYWNSLAEKGIIPYNPDVKPEPAIFKGIKIKAYHVKDGDSPDIPTAPSSLQSENSVILDFKNENVLFNSNNSLSYNGYSLYGADYLYSLEAAETWEGSIHGPNGDNWGDPAVGIDNLGRWYVGYISTSGGQKVSYSDNHGQNWTAKTVANKPGSGYYDMCDKNHLWVDTKEGSPYENYVYDAWTDFGGPYNYEIVFKRSTDRGQTWGTKIALSEAVNAGGHNQGVNLATGPNGEVYAAWAVYDGGLTEKAIGFCKSVNGGASFAPAVRAFNNIYGIRNIGVPQNMRVNSFPAMAVDVSDGPYSGNIYIVWSNRGVPGVNTGSDFDIYMLRSTDGGETWDTPIRVNQDPSGLGKKHFLPWIAVDPVTGTLSVIFYDNRNTSAANKAEAWVAVSTNGGDTWEDFRVSDVEFTPQPLPGTAEGYFGDYIGITAYNGKVYPVWTDNRTGHAMSYVSPFETIVVNDPYNFTATTDQETGIVQLSWMHEQGSGFLNYRIYRDNILIDSTTDHEYTDTLQDYAYVNYSVVAVYTGGNESMPIEANTQYGTSITEFTPDTVIKVLYITDTTGVSSANVTNEGTLYSIFNYSPFVKTGFDVPQYKPAYGGGDEFINRVTIANLDNFTPYEGYMNFDNMPVQVEQGNTYEITVRTKNAYRGDKCAVWVDWNHNGEFDEAQVILKVNDENDLFNGQITIPEGYGNEYYKMRIRLVSVDGELTPYGNSQYGEVEDYLLVPGTWLSFEPTIDTVEVNDTSVITFNFKTSGMNAGVYTKNLKFEITDLDTPTKDLFVIMNLSALNVEASATDSTVCKGDEIQLFADATGNTGTLSFEWKTLSGQFVSNEQNPMVTIDSTVSFVVAAYDTLQAVKYDTVEITAYDLPVVDLGADTSFCGQTDTAYIMLDAGTNGISYLWSTGDTTQTLKLNKEKLGDYGEYEIYVTVTNENGCSLTDTVMVNMKDCTAIDEHEQNVSVSVFPNPNNGIFTLTLNSKSRENVNIKVISITGAVVYNESNVKLDNITRKKIQLDNVANGVYTIIVEQKDFITTHKVVVSK